MQNSKKLEKSKGVVILAKNTETIDYVKLANQASEFVNKFLNLPVTILEPESNNFKNTRDRESWNNLGRWEVYHKSPYDTTILLDSDYIVLNDNLLKFAEGNFDYRIPNENTWLGKYMDDNRGNFQKTLWATIVIFQKTSRTELLFEMVSRIEKRYDYYQRLFKLDYVNFRNDFAFTIADLLLSGYCFDYARTTPITTIKENIKSMDTIGSLINIKTETKNLVYPMSDLHIMDKKFLLSDSFRQFKETILG